MKSNPIRRKFLGIWALIYDGDPIARKSWIAICPECNETIIPKSGYPDFASPTRKCAKDVLYRHMKKKHKPGLVGH